jgi:hypothetical protein
MDSLTMDPLSRKINTFLKYYFIIFNILLVATYISIGFTSPDWLSIFDYYLKIAISVFLIYRFNPFRHNIVFEELDRRVAFSAGMILITSSVINKILPNIITKYRATIVSKINMLVNR